MADKPVNDVKTIMWYCKGCASPIEVPIPEYAKKVERIPCECGKTEEERIAKWVSLGAIALFLSLFGSCVAHNHYSTEQVKAVAEKYEVYKKVPGTGYPMGPDYDITEKKPAAEKAPEPTRPPVDGRAPQPKKEEKK
jgi:hypothetical protein